MDIGNKAPEPDTLHAKRHRVTEPLKRALGRGGNLRDNRSAPVELRPVCAHGRGENNVATLQLGWLEIRDGDQASAFGAATVCVHCDTLKHMHAEREVIRDGG